MLSSCAAQLAVDLGGFGVGGFNEATGILTVPDVTSVGSSPAEHIEEEDGDIPAHFSFVTSEGLW
mgnify:CR=1 FL=1